MGTSRSALEIRKESRNPPELTTVVDLFIFHSENVPNIPSYDL